EARAATPFAFGPLRASLRAAGRRRLVEGRGEEFRELLVVDALRAHGRARGGLAPRGGELAPPELAPPPAPEPPPALVRGLLLYPDEPLGAAVPIADPGELLGRPRVELLHAHDRRVAPRRPFADAFALLAMREE